ncbi:MAG: helix-turn-helix domain-containing protein, partial [Ruthenibacterium lactatiformans]
MDDICVRVKLIRTSFKMSQKDFSLRLGVTNAHISRIEKGLTRPSAALVKLIC